MVANTRKVVKVFLASPGDLQNERALAKATVDEFNDTIGRSLGYHVDLVGWEKMESEKRVMFETFGDEREYLRKLRRCIFAYIQSLATQDAEQKSEQQQERPTSNADAPAKQEQGAGDSLFSNSGMAFLREFLDRAQTKQAEPTPLDVARFRLLADIAQRSGNDEGLLGVHDANLIYLGISSESLGRRELNGLADCGFRHFSTQSTPLWKWVASIKHSGFTSLSSYVGPNDQRQGALLAMSLTCDALWVDDDFPRKEYLNSWFAPETHSSIKAAALTYLGVAGLPEDLEWVDREIKRNDVHTRITAVQAAIRIRLREGQSEAIQAIIELEPSNLEDELIKKIFDGGTSIDTDQMDLLLQNRIQKVRNAALRIAKQKSLLTIDIANRLLSDSDADVRYEALNYLKGAGRAFSDGEAKTALVKPTAGILYSGDSNGERVFEQYQIEQLFF